MNRTLSVWRKCFKKLFRIEQRGTIRRSPEGKPRTKEVISKLSSKGSSSGYSHDFCLTEQYMQAWSQILVAWESGIGKKSCH